MKSSFSQTSTSLMCVKQEFSREKFSALGEKDFKFEKHCAKSVAID
jgi:hypothetical protein